MLVTNVGDDTLLGQIARRLSGETEEEAKQNCRSERSTAPETREKRIHRRLTISKASTPLQEKLAVTRGPH